MENFSRKIDTELKSYAVLNLFQKSSSFDHNKAEIYSTEACDKT